MSGWRQDIDFHINSIGNNSIYVAKREDAVYVLHAFQKKTQRTRQADIEIAKKRYQLLRG